MVNLTIAIIAGVLVFSLSQYLQHFIFEPILDLIKTLSNISHVLLLNQPKILNGNTNDENLKNTIHALSAKLRSSIKLIPFYEFLYKIMIFGIPPKDNILSAYRELNLIGCNVTNTGIPAITKENENQSALEKLHRLLNIETTYAEPADKP